MALTSFVDDCAVMVADAADCCCLFGEEERSMIVRVGEEGPGFLLLRLLASSAASCGRANVMLLVTPSRK